MLTPAPAAAPTIGPTAVGGARARTGHAPSDRGFTLVELVIAVAILGIIMTAFVAIIATSLTVGRATENRLDSSNALRRLESRFTDDVASSTEVVTSASAKCGGGTALIELRGRTFNPVPDVAPAVEPATFSTAVAYVLGQDGTLTRRVCKAVAPTNGTTPIMTPTQAVPLVDGLDAATVSCARGDGSSVDCASAGADAVYTLTLTPQDGEPQSLSATSRAS